MRGGGLCVLLLVSSFALSVAASAVPGAAQDEKLTPAEIGVDNCLFLRIRTPAAGVKIEERAKLLDQRLVEIFSYENTLSPNVWIGNIRGKPTIYVGRTQLVTVYPRDAEANNSTCERLAAHWAERLRNGLPQVAPTRMLKAPPEQ
jgi:hypothetical protein